MPANFSPELISSFKAALTGMDQTYGKTAAGDDLRYIDNMDTGKPQAWTTPDDWKITASIEGNTNGGKFVIYKNETTKQVKKYAQSE